MKIEFDPSKIKVEQIVLDKDGNKIVVDSGKTLADHYKTCKGCAYCD